MSLHFECTLWTTSSSRLSVLSSTSSEIHSVRRHIHQQLPDIYVILLSRLPKAYPNMVPQVQIQKPTGVTPQQVEALTATLKDTAKTLIGSEMVYELATAASSFLTENNAALRFGKYTSLNEDRTKRAVEAKNEAATQAALAEQELQKRRQEEDTRLQAQIEAENRKRALLRQERLESETEAESSGANQSDGLELAVVERFQKPLLLPGNLQADMVVKGSEIRRSVVGPLYHAEAVVSSRHGVRLPAMLVTIDIYGPYYLSSPGQRKLEQLEEDIQDLLQLRHANVLVIYGYEKRPVKDMISQGWRLSLVTEPLLRSTLHELLEDVGELKLQRALPYFKEIAAGIEFLHASHTAHRSVDVHNVHIGRSDTGELMVKLSAASWLRYLLDMNRSNSFLPNDPPVLAEEW
jgi:translation initiation factor 2-alpha kinase 4